ncbi:hypothetical protein [Streptomyces sp. SAS_260]
MSGTSATRAWRGGVRGLRRTLLPWAMCAALLLARCDGAGSAAKG